MLPKKATSGSLEELLRRALHCFPDGLYVGFLRALRPGRIGFQHDGDGGEGSLSSISTRGFHSENRSAPPR